MADDYLLQAAIGALEGFEKAYLPHVEEKRRRESRRIQLQDELAVYPQKKQIESDIELGQQKELERFKYGLKPSKTVYLKSEILKMTPEERASLPKEITIVDDKSESDVDKKSQGRERVTGNLSQLLDLYSDLDEQGGIVSTEKGSLQNIVASGMSSGIGQIAGGKVGSKAQSLRNQINQLRPLLIQDIRAASNMGAKGLDSEKELEFYLQAATDPTKDIQTNLNALKVLDRAYGLGTLKTELRKKKKLAEPSIGRKKSKVIRFDENGDQVNE